MKAISIAIPMNFSSNVAPSFAVFRMTSQDLQSLVLVQPVIDQHNLSQVRREVFDIDLQSAEGDFYTPELVITKHACWLSLKWYEGLGDGREVTSQPMEISDLIKAFESSAGGEMHLLGKDNGSLWRMLADDPDSRWDEMPIGYQVVNTKTDAFWNDLPSFVILTSHAEAQEDLEHALKEDSAWSLHTIKLNTIEEPAFSD